MQNFSDHIPTGRAHFVGGFVRSLALIGAFFVYLIQITELLTLRDFTVVFYVLLSSFCFARILASGWEGELRKLLENCIHGLPFELDRPLSGATITILLGLFAWICTATVFPPAIILHTPFGFVALAILTALFSSLHILAATCRTSNLIKLYLSNVTLVILVVSNLLVQAMSEIREMDASLVLGCHILTAVIFLFLTLTLRRKPEFSGHKQLFVSHNMILARVGQQALRYGDIILAGWLLTGYALSIYLTLRVCVFLVDTVFVALSSATFLPLSALYQTAPTRDFRATAARVNLSFLLIGGSSALAMMQVGPFFLDYLKMEGPLSNQILAWLVFARGAPLVFGANELFLSVSQHQKAAALLSWSFATLLVIVLCSMDSNDGVLFAKGYAMILVAYNISTAIYIARSMSIWPGLTAVFHGQLRLL